MEKGIKFKVYCRKEIKDYDLNGASTAKRFRQTLQSDFQILVNDQRFVGLALNVCDQHEQFQFFLSKSRYVFMLSSEHDSNTNYNSCLSEYAALRYRLSLEEHLPSEKIDTSFITSLCLSDVILPPKGSFPKGNILILHFFKKNTRLTEIFYENIRMGHHEFNFDTVTIFGWDVSIEETHKGILDAVHVFGLNNPDIEKMIREHHDALLFLTYDGTAFMVVSILRGKMIDEEEFTRKLNFVLHMVSDICHEEPQQNIRSASAIQHEMYEQFGHKDYDCYDSCDHDLLKRKLAFAFYGRPENPLPEGNQLTESTDEMMFYSVKQRAWVEKAYAKIRTHNNTYSKWSDKIVMRIVYNCTESLDRDPNKMSMYPVFILRKCKRGKVMDFTRNSQNTKRSNNENLCVIVIDHTLRVYQSWDLYIEKNTLPKCIMCLPKNGKYTGDPQTKKVQIQCIMSPKCGVGHKVLTVTDISSTVASLGSGAMFGLALIPSITLAPFVLPVAAAIGAGAGLYAIGRSGFTIHDRRVHDEDLSFSDSEARAAYFNIVAGSVGFVSMGAITALQQIAASGTSVNTITRGVVNGINVVNIGASGVALGNSVVDVVRNSFMEGELPSALTIVQLSSSLLFFGNSVYNFRSANQIITESQVNTLRSLENSMKSNNQRKTLNKLVKETIRQNDGNTQAGHAEVIATMRRVGDPSEVIAALRSSNKLFNQNKVRFSASGGDIHLNGIAVDVNKFAQMARFDKAQYLTKLPEIPTSNFRPSTSTGLSITSSTNINVVETTLNNPKFERWVMLGIRMLTSSTSERIHSMIHIFSEVVQEQIIQVAMRMTEELNNYGVNIGELFQGIHSKAGPFFYVIQAILDYTENVLGHNATFRFIRRSVDLFERVFRYINWGAEAVIRDFMQFFANWAARKVCEYWEHERRKQGRRSAMVEFNDDSFACDASIVSSVEADKRGCSECCGYNYCRGE